MEIMHAKATPGPVLVITPVLVLTFVQIVASLSKMVNVTKTLQTAFVTAP